MTSLRILQGHLQCEQPVPPAGCPGPGRGAGHLRGRREPSSSGDHLTPGPGLLEEWAGVDPIRQFPLVSFASSLGQPVCRSIARVLMITVHDLDRPCNESHPMTSMPCLIDICVFHGYTIHIT